jgi:phage shock protein PspC (stress-responsive transcriptional regulator)
MKKIININLSSRLIPIEDSAYELLKSYLDSLKLHFSREEGGEEIVSDIEDRIAEVFQDKLKKGAHCITDEDINSMVNVMGRPDQLEEETATEPQEKNTGRSTAGTVPPSVPVPKRLMRDENDKILGGVCSGIATYYGIDPVIVRIITFLLIWAWGAGLIVYIILWLVLPSSRTLQNPVRKRLYRNPDNKVVGGVCSGIAAYANIDPVVPRIIFVLPLLGIIFTSIFHHWLWLPQFFFPLSVGTLPTLIVLYIILWISVPRANTVTEKLEMRGEKVDLQSITNAMKGPQGPQDEKKNDGPGAVTPVSTDAAPGEVPPVIQSRAITPYYPPAPHRRRTGLGDVIILLLKIMAYFILAVIIIGLLIALIGMAGGFIGAATFSSLALPYKGLILNSPLQHILAWPAVLLTLGIPVVAIIWLFIKLITGFRPKNKYVGVSLFILWVIGLICGIWLCLSIGRDFRMNFRKSTPFAIEQPTSNKLILSRTPSNISIGGFNLLNNIIQLGDDTLVLKTINLDILKSKDDSFHVVLVRGSNGHSIREAKSFTSEINLNLTQQDSMLYIPEGFSMALGTPFRNQHVLIQVFVPEGKYIRIDDNLRSLRNFRGWSGRWDWDDDDDWGSDHYWNRHWDYNEDYKMTPDGLKSASDLKKEKDLQNEIDSLPPPPPAPLPDSADKRYRYKQTSVSNAGKGKGTVAVFNDAGIISPFL